MIGAGPAESVAALVLARAGVPVTLLSGPRRNAFAIGESLPPAARPVLAALGLEEQLKSQGHEPALGNRSAWGSDILGATDFIMHPFGHGWHLDREAFDRGLRDAALDAGAIPVDASLRSVEGSARAWRVHVVGEAGASTIEADRVIDCSGRRAAFARRQGARRMRRDRLLACAALLTATTSDPDATTLIEATREGWWYTARLPDATRIAMFMTDSDLPTAREIRAPDVFRSRLADTQHLAPLCAAYGYHLASPLQVVAADTGRLDVVCGDGWFAAGDAAASFDPVSSQGIMSAMQFGQRAAEAILLDNPLPYAAAVDALFDRYCSAHTEVYAQERRWTDAPFWGRRHQRIAIGEAERAH